MAKELAESKCHFIKNFRKIEKEKLILLKQLEDLQEDLGRSLTEKESLIEEIPKN
jgi:hypothetical protein